MILDLNHVNIVTSRLAETRAFFVDVLGLSDGPRPNFPFAGHWLYAGDKAVIHLQDFDADGTRGASGPLDHAAFDVADLAAAKRRLEANGVAYQEIRLTKARGQLFLRDPNGVRIELGGPVPADTPDQAS